MPAPLRNRAPVMSKEGTAVMTASTVTEVAGIYFEAWQAGDFERVRSVLADDVT